jgi:hypothetical protein
MRFSLEQSRVPITKSFCFSAMVSAVLGTGQRQREGRRKIGASEGLNTVQARGSKRKIRGLKLWKLRGLK